MIHPFGGEGCLHHRDVSADTIVTDNSGDQHFQWRCVPFDGTHFHHKGQKMPV